MPQKRLFGSAAVFTNAVLAGIIESSNGSASVTPIPLRKLRRGRCFLVMNATSGRLSNLEKTRSERRHGGFNAGIAEHAEVRVGQNRYAGDARCARDGSSETTITSVHGHLE